MTTTPSTPTDDQAAAIAMDVVSSRMMVVLGSVAAFVSFAIVAVQSIMRLRFGADNGPILAIGGSLLWVSLVTIVLGSLRLRRARWVEAEAYGLSNATPSKETP